MTKRNNYAMTWKEVFSFSRNSGKVEITTKQKYLYVGGVVRPSRTTRGAPRGFSAPLVSCEGASVSPDQDGDPVRSTQSPSYSVCPPKIPKSVSGTRVRVTLVQRVRFDPHLNLIHCRVRPQSSGGWFQTGFRPPLRLPPRGGSRGSHPGRPHPPPPCLLTFYRYFGRDHTCSPYPH